MRGNAKSLKRNDEARKGILIAPPKLPRRFHDSLPPTEVGLETTKWPDGKPTLCRSRQLEEEGQPCVEFRLTGSGERRLCSTSFSEASHSRRADRASAF